MERERKTDIKQCDWPSLMRSHEALTFSSSVDQSDLRVDLCYPINRRVDRSRGSTGMTRGSRMKIKMKMNTLLKSSPS